MCDPKGVLQYQQLLRKKKFKIPLHLFLEAVKFEFLIQEKKKEQKLQIIFQFKIQGQSNYKRELKRFLFALMSFCTSR